MPRPPKQPIGLPSITTALDAADVLKAIRDLKGWSQDALAEQTGIKRQQISAWENRRYTTVMDSLTAIAAVAGVKIEVTIHAPEGATPKSES
jgi:transcriptional regulator with XRE-family HTH domain